MRSASVDMPGAPPGSVEGGSRRTFWFLSLLLCCLALEACSDIGTGPRLSGNDKDVLMVQGHRLVEAIEAYRTAHAKYPMSFADAGIAPSDTATEFGPWSYRRSEADPSFDLSVGDYGRNCFKLSWRPSDGSWYWDE